MADYHEFPNACTEVVSRGKRTTCLEHNGYGQACQFNYVCAPTLRRVKKSMSVFLGRYTVVQ